MIDGHSVLGVIPARGGSERKGSPARTSAIWQKSPCAWTIEAAHKSKYIDRLIFSATMMR